MVDDHVVHHDVNVGERSKEQGPDAFHGVRPGAGRQR